MKPDILRAVCIGVTTNALLLGLGALIILSVPELADNARYLVPALIVSGLLLSPFVAWRVVPLGFPRR